MLLSNAQTGFCKSFRAAGNSKSTIELYKTFLGQLTAFLNDPDVNDITLDELEEYFVYLQDEYKPVRKNGDTRTLSASSLQNHWKAIRSFFNFCISPERKLVENNPAKGLKCPKGNSKAIVPFSKQEVDALLKCAVFANQSKPSNRKAFTMRRRTATRDIAMLLVLLDTGLRVGELTRLQLRHYDEKEQCIYVEPFGNSGRKTKSRPVYISDRTASVLWDYLAKRDRRDASAPLFLADKGEGITPNSVRLLFADLGKKAGIKEVHPHRFRHTFAIEFLRNGGEIFTLRKILGHSDVKMCQHYLEISNADVAHAQNQHSPVAEWKLGVGKAKA